MKRIFCCLFILWLTGRGVCSGQTLPPIDSLMTGKLAATTKKGFSFKAKEHILPAVLMLLAGASDGMRDAVLFRNDKVLRKLNVNPNWWGPDSYLNKYKDRDPAKGPAYLGSTTFLVWTTDAPHFFKFTQNLFTVGAISVKIGQHKKKWWVYIVEGVGYWAINRAGFALVYYRF